MPLLDDSVLQQLRQYPYGPMFYFNPPDPRQIVARQRAEQEALQAPNIIGDVTQRLITPLATRVAGPTLGPKLGTYAGQMAPILAMGGADPEEDVAAVQRVTGELKPGAVTEWTMRPRPALMSGFAGQTEGLGEGKYMSPESRMSWWRWQPGQRWSGAAETNPLLPGTVKEAPHAGLPFQQVQYHGLEGDPLTHVVPPEMVSSYGGLQGPGLYTSDDVAISGPGTPENPTYAGSSGTSYRVWEVKPVKFIDSDNEPIPGKVLTRVQQLLEQRGMPKDAELWNPGERNFRSGEPMSKARAYDVFEHPPRTMGTNKADVMDALIQAMQEEGYGGVKHMGGIKSGGKQHTVKIYWNPEDYRMRQIGVAKSTKVRLPSKPPPIMSPEQQARWDYIQNQHSGWMKQYEPRTPPQIITRKGPFGSARGMGRVAILDQLFPHTEAGAVIDGMEVGNRIPDPAKVYAAASAEGARRQAGGGGPFTQNYRFADPPEFTQLKGIRQFPMSQVSENLGWDQERRDTEKINQLAGEMRVTGRVDPIVIAYSNMNGSPYILQGRHELSALHRLGVRNFPAIVVIEH